jgi:hypothetical protein
VQDPGAPATPWWVLALVLLGGLGSVGVVGGLMWYRRRF